MGGPGVLELEAQAELHAASSVSAVEMQKAGSREAAGIARRGAVHGTVDAVVLRMVEEVVDLPAKFESGLFLDGEALEEAHIEVGAAREIQRVATNRAVGQTDGDYVRPWIVVERTIHTAGRSGVLLRLSYGERVANDVRPGACASAVAQTGGVAVRGAIGHAEGRAGLDGDDARERPATEKDIGRSRFLEERHGPDEADAEVVAHVEVGAGA